MRKRISSALLLGVLLVPGAGWAQMRTSGIVGIAGGAGLGSAGPLAGGVAPVAGPLLGGLVPLLGGLESIPTVISVGVRVQPRERDEFLNQFSVGQKAFFGISTDLVVGAPPQERGTLSGENTDNVLFVRFGAFDITQNPRTNEVQFGFSVGDQNILPIFDATPFGPNLQTSGRVKVPDNSRQ